MLYSSWAITICLVVVAFSTDFGNPVGWALKQNLGGRHIGCVLGWGICGVIWVPVFLHLFTDGCSERQRTCRIGTRFSWFARLRLALWVPAF